jgi:hypothetical protein
VTSVDFSLAVKILTKKRFRDDEIFLTFEVLFIFLYHLTMKERAACKPWQCRN